jgi:hypothetical protein
MSVNLDNSNKRLKAGIVRLLRDNVSGWSTNSQHGVANVWPSTPPESVNNEFPRGSVDIVDGEDFDLSVDLDVRLREVTVKIVVFAESEGPAETLIDDVEDAVVDYWDQNDSNNNQYTGDWTYRQVDGFTPLAENEGDKGNLRYNKSINIVFETVKVN